MEPVQPNVGFTILYPFYTCNTFFVFYIKNLSTLSNFQLTRGLESLKPFEKLKEGLEAKNPPNPSNLFPSEYLCHYFKRLVEAQRTGKKSFLLLGKKQEKIISFFGLYNCGDYRYDKLEEHYHQDIMQLQVYHFSQSVRILLEIAIQPSMPLALIESLVAVSLSSFPPLLNPPFVSPNKGMKLRQDFHVP